MKNAVSRLLLTLALLALTAGLLSLPTTAASAAEVVNPAQCSKSRAAVTATARKVSSAKQSETRKRTAYHKALKAQKAAKKRKAKNLKAHARKVSSASSTLKKAKSLTASRSKALATHKARVKKYCAVKPTPAPTAQEKQADALGDLLAATLAGAGANGLDTRQLTGLLDVLAPAGTAALDPALLTRLLAGAGSVEGGAAGLAGLFDQFSTQQFTELLSGAASSELLGRVLETLVSGLTSLGGLPTGDLDPTALAGQFDLVLASLQGLLDPAQIGDLLAVFGAGAGIDRNLFGFELTDLLGVLAPAGSFDPTQLSALLQGLNGGLPGQSELLALLGGRFSADQVTQLLGGLASPELFADFVSVVAAQLTSLGGGAFDPGALTGTVLTDLLGDLVDVLTELLGGLLGGLLGDLLDPLLP